MKGDFIYNMILNNLFKNKNITLRKLYFYNIYLFGGEREQEQEGERGRERERESQVDSMLSGEPDLGLDLTTLKS